MRTPSLTSKSGRNAPKAYAVRKAKYGKAKAASIRLKHVYGLTA
jgi:hypothetical protein